MRRMRWIGVAAVLVFVLGMAGCGGGNSPPAASSPPATAPGGPMGGPPGAGSPAPEAPKPPAAEPAKTETKASDGEDDPWGNEKPTVSGAVGKAMLRGFTQGESAKTDEAPKFGR